MTIRNKLWIFPQREEFIFNAADNCIGKTSIKIKTGPY